MVWRGSRDSNLFVPGASFLSIFVRKLYPILGYRGMRFELPPSN